MYAVHHGKLDPRRTSVRVTNALLIIGVAAMALGYLVMINRSATKGFHIRALEQKISSLEDQRKKLDLQALASQSMGSIESHVGGLGFVPVADLEYLSGSAGPVAVR